MNVIRADEKIVLRTLCAQIIVMFIADEMFRSLGALSLSLSPYIYILNCEICEVVLLKGSTPK